MENSGQFAQFWASRKTLVILLYMKICQTKKRNWPEEQNRRIETDWKETYSVVYTTDKYIMVLLKNKKKNWIDTYAQK